VYKISASLLSLFLSHFYPFAHNYFPIIIISPAASAPGAAAAAALRKVAAAQADRHRRGSQHRTHPAGPGARAPPPRAIICATPCFISHILSCLLQCPPLKLYPLSHTRTFRTGTHIYTRVLVRAHSYICSPARALSHTRTQSADRAHLHLHLRPLRSPVLRG
jgi:hypothetical protein